MTKRNLLIDEYPLMVLPSLATWVGLGEAIVLAAGPLLAGQSQGQHRDRRRPLGLQHLRTVAGR